MQNLLIQQSSYLSLNGLHLGLSGIIRSELATVDKFTCHIELVAEYFLGHNINIIPYFMFCIISGSLTFGFQGREL